MEIDKSLYSNYPTQIILGPRNGKKIKIWNDNIMGNQPLLQLQELHMLKSLA
jgi:hypothetical protein